MNERKSIQIAEPCVDDREWQALKESIDTGWLSQGQKVAAFEKAFAQRHAVQYAIASSSGTTALHLALLTVGVKPGDAVIVPSFTWVATANAVEYCGALPYFCDIDPQTFTIDPDNVRIVIEQAAKRGINVKALIPVHLFGIYANMDRILELAREYNLKVVEDAACAAGASYKGKAAGNMGDIGCFSFHPRKVIVTGEGGMCTTNNAEQAELMNSLRNHGASVSEEQRHYGNAPYLLPDFNILGYNYRMTDLQGAIGMVQVERLDRLVNERQVWAEWYTHKLKDIEWLQTPVVTEGCKPSWQSFVCTVNEDISPMSRNKIMEYLQEKGIASRPGTQAVHTLGYYKQKYGLHDEDFPCSFDAYRTSLAIPLHNCMKDEDFAYVVKVLREL